MDRDKVIIESKDYRLLEYRGDGDGWPYWLENREGEGMSMSAHDLDDMLRKYFEENF